MWKKIGLFLLKGVELILTGGNTFSVKFHFEYPPKAKDTEQHEQPQAQA